MSWGTGTSWEPKNSLLIFSLFFLLTQPDILMSSQSYFCIFCMFSPRSPVSLKSCNYTSIVCDLEFQQDMNRFTCGGNHSRNLLRGASPVLPRKHGKARQLLWTVTSECSPGGNLSPSVPVASSRVTSSWPGGHLWLAEEEWHLKGEQATQAVWLEMTINELV